MKILIENCGNDDELKLGFLEYVRDEKNILDCFAIRLNIYCIER